MQYGATTMFYNCMGCAIFLTIFREYSTHDASRSQFKYVDIQPLERPSKDFNDGVHGHQILTWMLFHEPL